MSEAPFLTLARRMAEAGDAPAAIRLATKLLQQGDAQAAEAAYRAALPAPAAHHGLAAALHRQGRHEAAWAAYRDAIATLPDPTAARIDAAGALLALSRPAEALDLLAPIQAAQPPARAALLWRHRAAALLRLDRLEDSLAASTACLALDPDNPEAHTGAAHALLALGRLPEGWAAFEHRWRLLDNARDWHSRPTPLWRGETDPAGHTILLHAEQGLGDTLQFARYAPLLQARGARVILQVQRPLLRLMQGLAGQVIADDEAPPRHDLHTPLMTLPLAFATTLATIPAAIPYLHPDPEAVARWRRRLPPRAIGLVWAGAPRPEDPAASLQDRRRSLPLAALAPLALPGLTLVSLQKGQAATQPPPPGMTLLDWTHDLHDFADTAALVAALDAVVSVDTSVAHLAGALGRPVLLLNRFDSCWRWLRGRDDSPWYPTLHQFRQPAPDDWATPIAAAAAALAARFPA